MQAHTIELIGCFISAAGIFVTMFVLVFRTGKIVQKIEHLEAKVDKIEIKMEDGFRAVDQRFKEVDQRFKEVDRRFEKLEENIPTIFISLTKLEVRLEERTLKTFAPSKKKLSPNEC